MEYGCCTGLFGNHLTIIKVNIDHEKINVNSICHNDNDYAEYGICAESNNETNEEDRTDIR